MASKNDNLIEDGYTREFKKPGLGIEVDWENYPMPISMRKQP